MHMGRVKVKLTVTVVAQALLSKVAAALAQRVLAPVHRDTFGRSRVEASQSGRDGGEEARGGRQGERRHCDV